MKKDITKTLSSDDILDNMIEEAEKAISNGNKGEAGRLLLTIGNYHNGLIYTKINEEHIKKIYYLCGLLRK